MMNLYLLKLTPLGEQSTPVYEVALGFLVRACSGEAARGIIASAKESYRDFDWRPGTEGARTWLEPELSTCEEIAEGVEGASGVLLRDYIGR
jgi:hypothetical protein